MLDWEFIAGFWQLVRIDGRGGKIAHLQREEGGKWFVIVMDTDRFEVPGSRTSSELRRNARKIVNECITQLIK